AVSVSSDTEAEALVFDLQQHGYRVRTTVEQEHTGRLATARLDPPGEPQPGIVVDLLFASSGIEPEIAAEAELIELLPGLNVRVATVPQLVALKVLARDDARRPQDLIDLRSLLAVSTDADLGEVRALLRRIHERRFDRGRDLLGAFEELLGAQP
ncbi:nucleotidyl transferase AbiEii/AbiGii toxin family protein, partial [Planctomycetota bacterium]